MAKKNIEPRIFEGDDGQWYWSLESANGQIVCRAEGYSNKSNAKRAFRSAQRVMAKAVL